MHPPPLWVDGADLETTSVSTLLSSIASVGINSTMTRSFFCRTWRGLRCTPKMFFVDLMKCDRRRHDISW